MLRIGRFFCGRRKADYQASKGESMPDIDFRSLIESANKAARLDDLLEPFSRILACFEFEILQYFVIQQDYASFSFDRGVRAGLAMKAIAEFYKDDRPFDFDPTLKKLIRRMKPFHWHQITEDPNISELQLNICATYKREGFEDGVCFPVSTGPGDLAVICTSAKGRKFAISQTDLDLIHIACGTFHRRYNELANVAAFSTVELSDRESEVTALVLKGRSNKEIAQRLGISAHTVDAHLRRVFEKLGARNRLEAAVKYALVSGF